MTSDVSALVRLLLQEKVNANYPDFPIPPAWFDPSAGARGTRATDD